MYSLAGLGGGTFDKWTPLAELLPGGSGLWCWLMAGLPAHRHARFFICTASPELRQLLTDNEAMYT